MHVWENAKLLTVVFFVLNSFFSVPALAGEFSAHIKNATLEAQDDEYTLDADLDYVLSPAAKEAIESSIPLIWHLKVQLKQIRYLRNKTLVDLNYGYKIRYRALLNNYSVTQLDSHTEKKYPSLAEALESLSQIRGLKIMTTNALKKHKHYEVALKLEFDKEQLPAPLRPTAYFDSEWDLSSDWYVWELDELK
jgi:Domain of unknown function (DUF4390)